MSKMAPDDAALLSPFSSGVSVSSHSAAESRGFVVLLLQHHHHRRRGISDEVVALFMDGEVVVAVWLSSCSCEEEMVLDGGFEGLLCHDQRMVIEVDVFVKVDR